MKDEKISTINSHIEDYLDYYCNLKHQPEYAVLLKGSWGAGKTWFIKRYCEKLNKQQQKYLYVSLYGMTTYADIEADFFQQLHPILSSKSMTFIRKIIIGALKTTFKIDLDSDNKGDTTISYQIPDLNIQGYFDNTENYILIFDDLERCAISTENILGYINHFIEHQGLKVIIVANEDQIIKSEKKEQSETEKSYKIIKEKLIGKTLEVASDIDSALTNFVDKVTNQCTRDFLRKNTTAVKEIYSTADYENLRCLIQALWDFERLFLRLPEEIKKKDELVRQLLQLLLVFSFEIRLGKIQPSEIEKIRPEYFAMLASENKEENNLTKLIEKYAIFDLVETLLTEKDWIDFFDKGIINDKNIKESLLKSKYFEDENTPDWVKLWHYHHLTDEKFEALLHQVETNFGNNKYNDIGVIKHIVGLLLQFSEIGLIDRDKSIILQEAKKNIDFLNAKEQLIVSDKLSDSTSYSGLTFAGNDFTEFRQLVDYIEDIMEKAENESMPDKGTELLKIMTTDIYKFCHMVCLCNSPDQIYCDKPILKYIEPNKFVETFLSMNPKDKRTAISALNKRYAFDQLNMRLIDELKWLKEVRKIMIEEHKKRARKISGYILKSEIIPNMDKFIKKLESAI